MHFGKGSGIICKGILTGETEDAITSLKKRANIYSSCFFALKSQKYDMTQECFQNNHKSVFEISVVHLSLEAVIELMSVTTNGLSFSLGGFYSL